MATKAVAIIKKDSQGAPDIGTGWDRWVWIGDLPGNYAVYIIVGTGAQLTAIQANANCIGGLVVTNNGSRWAELDQAIPTSLKNKINAYRASQGQGNIGAGTTLLQVIQVAAATFDWGITDCWDG